MSMRISDRNSVFIVKNEINTDSGNVNSASHVSVGEYSKMLEQKYSYFKSSAFINGVSVSVGVSDEYLRKCTENPEISAAFEKKLDELPDYIAGMTEKYTDSLKSINCKFDEDGKQSVSVILLEEKADDKSKVNDNDNEMSEEESGKTSVAVNVEKRSRQIASAKTQKQIKAVIELLKGDVSDCKEGLSKGWCDENEVAKAEALLKRAEEKQAQLPADTPENDDVNSEMEFLLNMLM